MITIVQNIDAWTEAQYAGITKKLFGYCELMTKTTGTTASEQPMPVKIIDGKPDRGNEHAALDDRYQLITWIRLTAGPSKVQNDDDQWGLKEGGRQRATLRWVVAHKVELGENFILELLRDFPDRFSIDGYDFVFIDRDIDVDPDHEQIYLTELGKNNYEKHRFNWNIYALELQVEFILCVEV